MFCWSPSENADKTAVDGSHGVLRPTNYCAPSWQNAAINTYTNLPAPCPSSKESIHYMLWLQKAIHYKEEIFLQR